MRSLGVRAAIGSALAALLIGLGPGRAVANHAGLCGSTPQYACSEILVILRADSRDTIADVVARHGGGTVLFQFHAVRDLLDPDGTADDTSDAVVYGVSVARGMELSAAADYAEDPAVYAAAVNRETIGSTTTPDTSTGPRQWAALPAWFSLLVLIMAVVVGTAARKRPF